MTKENNNMDIYFDKEDYIISYNDIAEYFKLPDGRILEAKYWVDSYPEQPIGLHVVENIEEIDEDCICDLKFAPKDMVFKYENQEYAVHHRMFMVQYIVLPDNTILEYNFPEVMDDLNEQSDIMKYIILTPVIVDINEELERENIIKAEKL